MATLVVSERFKKRLKRLGPQELERAKKSLKQFQTDHRHPHLHFERLKASGLHTIRVDQNFRIVLQIDDTGAYEAIDVANHKTVDQKYG